MPAAYASEVEQKLRLLPVSRDKWPEDLKAAVNKDMLHIKESFYKGTNSPVDPVFANPTLGFLAALELYAALHEMGFPYKSPQAAALANPPVEVSPGQMAVQVETPTATPVVAPTTSNEAQIIASQPALDVAAQIQTQSESGAANQAANNAATEPTATVAAQIAAQTSDQSATEPVAQISPQNVVVETTEVVAPTSIDQTAQVAQTSDTAEKKGGAGGLLALAAAAAGVYFLTRN